MNKKFLIGSVCSTCFGAVLYSTVKYIMHGSDFVYEKAKIAEKIRTKADVILEEDGYYSIRKKNDEPFRILQLTDMHIGGGYLSRHEDVQALGIMKKLIEMNKPDCIVLTGDLVCSKMHITWSRNNLNSIKIIARMLENIGIPYAVTFGNHDSEKCATNTRQEIAQYLMNNPHCLMVETNDNKDIKGYSNYLVKLRNKDGSMNSVLYMFDSNEYIMMNGKKSYDYIHDDQVKWYADSVKRINKEEGKNVPSHIFMHIPLKEYEDAWNAVINNEEIAEYYYGNKDEQISASLHDSKLFETALELESTQSIFCGHDHLNDFSVSYKGIRLTYGQGIDCVLYAKNLSEHKGATLLKINQKGSFVIKSRKHRRYK